MIDIAIDQITGSLALVDFDLKLIDDTDQIQQNLIIRLKFILREWYLDNTQGIPYYEDFFIKNPNQIRIESVLKQEIVNTDGVVELLAFESAYDDQLRKYSVRFSVRTISGEALQIEEELPWQHLSG